MDVDDERPAGAPELIDNFAAVTGAPAHVAEQYLGAHGWDLNTAVDFYLSHPPEGGGDDATFFDAGGDDGTQSGAGPPPLVAEEDEELRRALAASARDHGQQQQQHHHHQQQQGSPPLGPPRAEVIEVPDDDDYDPTVDYNPADDGGEGRGEAAAAAASLVQHRAAALEASREAMRMREDEMVDFAERAMRAAGFPPDLAAFPPLMAHGVGRRAAGGPSNSSDAFGVLAGGLPPPFGVGGGPAGPTSLQGGDSGAGGSGGGAGGADGGGDATLSFDVPDGIDVEEARMLEAAMLGVPYTGRMPAPRAPGPMLPVDPAAAAQRALRQEQDDAFEESLAADRAKQQSINEARRKQEEDAAAAAAAEAAENTRRKDAARQLRALLASKAAALPAEPPPGEAGAIRVVVRLPDGSRCGRRFRLADPLSAAFDFVDVHTCGDGSGSGEVSEGGLRPGSYRLVTQFPRRAYEAGQGGSLSDTGIAIDTALFVEPL